MMTITYGGRNSIYINITNKCPCACVFCLRNNKDHVFNSNSLWLEREPTVKEICDSIDAWDLDKYDEIVFCGYGEPTERLDDLLAVASYIKTKSQIKIRINTNGLADLIWNEKTAPKLKGLIDTVSVSLNADHTVSLCSLINIWVCKSFVRGGGSGKKVVFTGEDYR